MTSINAVVARRYGGRLGLIRHCQALALLSAGFLRDYTAAVPPVSGGRTVFVCKGNIARSAYAAARARQLGFQRVASAGIHAGAGSPASAVAVEAAAARGIDLRRHRARHIDELDLKAQDRVFVFELWQARALARRSPARVFLLGAWADPARPHIEDPFGRSRAYYVQCFEIIDGALQRLRAEQPACRNKLATPC